MLLKFIKTLSTGIIVNNEIIINKSINTINVLNNIIICSIIKFLSWVEGKRFFDIPYNWLIPLLTTNKEVIIAIIEEILICLDFKDIIIILENSGVKYFFNNSSSDVKSTLNIDAKKAHNEQIGIIDIIK